jgi:hypothetical protein
MKDFKSSSFAWIILTLVWLVVILAFCSCGVGIVPEAVATFFYAILVLVMLSQAEMPSWWNEYRDIAITCAVLISVTAGALIFVWGRSEGMGASWGFCAGFAAMLWALACLAGGFGVGFIFGIPRVDQPKEAGTKGANANTGNGPTEYALRVNTNLEQVSDWLTKIIVGVGLVELKTIPAHLHQASDWVAESYCTVGVPLFARASSFAGSMIVYFSIVGFLAGYLITRLFFAGAFGRADSKTYVPPTAFIPSTPTNTDARDKIRNYWAPNGKVDPDHEKLLTDWLQENNISVSLASFVSGGKFNAQRNQVINDLKIP